MLRSSGVLILTWLLAACSAKTVLYDDRDANPPAVTGSISYRQRIALPPDAVIKVRLVDASREDAASNGISELTIYTNGRQVPFEFEIDYRPAQIDERHTYVLEAGIEVNGRLRFITDPRYPVLTQGAPAHVDMLLKAVEGQ